MNFCLAGSTSSLGQCIFRYLENLLLVFSISLVAHCVSTLPVLLKSAAQILKSVKLRRRWNALNTGRAGLVFP